MNILSKAALSNSKMDFPTALQEVINGKKITRLEWSDPNIYVLLWQGFLTIKNHSGYHRLLISDGDLFSEDWIIALNN